MSGKLFSLPVMLAYNHFLQNHPAYSHCPGLEVGVRGEGVDEWKRQKVHSVVEILSKRTAPHICQNETCSTPSLNRLRGLSTRVSRLSLWVSNLPSQIQFPQWQNDNFRENICSIHSACENPLKFTMNASSLNPWDVLGSWGFLPSQHSWGKPKGHRDMK